MRLLKISLAAVGEWMEGETKEEAKVVHMIA